MGISDTEKIGKRLQKINASQEGKTSKCKYCKKTVQFIAINIYYDPNKCTELIKWECQNLLGDNHTPLCLRSEDYKPKFTKGDVILSQWKEHATFYIINGVDEENGLYDLIYQKKLHNSTRIPIKSIDNKSSKCNAGMVDAIYG